MPTTPEARFAQRVREGLAGCDVERIENRVNLGIPDMLIGLGDRFVMLELKVAKGLKVGLRPHQVAFLIRHSAQGRPCFVLVKDEGTTRRPASIFLYPGKDALLLAEQGLRLMPYLSWPSKGMPWLELVETLNYWRPGSG